MLPELVWGNVLWRHVVAPKELISLPGMDVGFQCKILGI